MKSFHQAVYTAILDEHKFVARAGKWKSTAHKTHAWEQSHSFLLVPLICVQFALKNVSFKLADELIKVSKSMYQAT